mmetsp:Transcript_2773/g.7595  ORF Transcript_2773/g.7595 Transcript_2773/m.7595 type:complete len:202 (-) Transcript_2773:2214-2819(-)
MSSLFSKGWSSPVRPPRHCWAWLECSAMNSRTWSRCERASLVSRAWPWPRAGASCCAPWSLSTSMGSTILTPQTSSTLCTGRALAFDLLALFLELSSSSGVRRPQALWMFERTSDLSTPETLLLPGQCAKNSGWQDIRSRASSSNTLSSSLPPWVGPFLTFPLLKALEFTCFELTGSHLTSSLLRLSQTCCSAIFSSYWTR